MSFAAWWGERAPSAPLPFDHLSAIAGLARRLGRRHCRRATQPTQPDTADTADATYSAVTAVATGGGDLSAAAGRKVPTLPTLPTLPMGYFEMIKVAIVAERSRDGSTFKAIKTVCRAPHQVCRPFRGARDLENEADAANYKVQ